MNQDILDKLTWLGHASFRINDGKIIYNSKKYKVTTNELIKKVHDQCSKGK